MMRTEISQALARARDEYLAALFLAADALRELEPDHELVRLVDARRDAMLAEGVAGATWLKEHEAPEG
jgi:hypothetical protein